MCTYLEAAQKARELFIKGEYEIPLLSACELPDKWLFNGRMYKDIKGAIYGECAVSVDKDTGKASWYNECIPSHIKEIRNAVRIELPNITITGDL